MDADPGEIRDAVLDVLRTASYRTSAAHMAGIIDSYGNGHLAVEVLEELAQPAK
jgi:hypothetical protein